jgi:hypothetical protein
VSAPLSMAPGVRAARNRVAAWSRSPARDPWHHPRRRGLGPGGFGGRREAVRGGGGRVRSAVWFGSGTGVTVAAGTVAAAGVSGLELGPVG